MRRTGPDDPRLLLALTYVVVAALLGATGERSLAVALSAPASVLVFLDARRARVVSPWWAAAVLVVGALGALVYAIRFCERAIPAADRPLGSLATTGVAGVAALAAVVSCGLPWIVSADGTPIAGDVPFWAANGSWLLVVVPAAVIAGGALAAMLRSRAWYALSALGAAALLVLTVAATMSTSWREIAYANGMTETAGLGMGLYLAAIAAVVGLTASAHGLWDDSGARPEPEPASATPYVAQSVKPSPRELVPPAPPRPAGPLWAGRREE